MACLPSAKPCGLRGREGCSDSVRKRRGLWCDCEILQRNQRLPLFMWAPGDVGCRARPHACELRLRNGELTGGDY